VNETIPYLHEEKASVQRVGSFDSLPYLSLFLQVGAWLYLEVELFEETSCLIKLECTIDVRVALELNNNQKPKTIIESYCLPAIASESNHRLKYHCRLIVQFHLLLLWIGH
jgi:hypothetical protein